MTDAGSFLHRRVPQQDQQSSRWQEGESVAALGGTLILDEWPRALGYSSDHNLYTRVHIRPRHTNHLKVIGYTDVQSISDPLRENIVFGADHVTPMRTRVQEEGRPKGILSAFAFVCERWALTRDDQFRLLGFPPGDMVAQGLLGGGLPASSQDIRERVGYVVGISIALGGLFARRQEAELAWLNQRRVTLDGKSPLQCMLQRRMVNLVQVSELLRQERGL